MLNYRLKSRSKSNSKCNSKGCPLRKPKLKNKSVTSSQMGMQPAATSDNFIKSNRINQINNIESEENYQLTEGALNQLDDAFETYIQSKNRTHVYFDIEMQNENVGRIIMELFDDIVPHTTKNFIHMVQTSYKGSIFHRIIKDFVIQGGDFINGDGTGSQSIYGNKFDDENFDMQHDSKYLLSMANSGPNTNGCQFFITLNPLPNLDNKHVVFGKVITNNSKNIIDKMGNILTNANDNPIVPCIISDCGIIEDVIDI